MWASARGHEADDSLYDRYAASSFRNERSYPNWWIVRIDIDLTTLLARIQFQCRMLLDLIIAHV